MQVITDLEQFNMEGRSAVTIGKFDGVHLGHRKLLGKILEQKADGMKTAVLTFNPSPEVFFGFGPDRELSTMEEKRRLFERLGIDYCIELPFNEQVAHMAPEAFVEDILVHRLHAAFVAAGTDLSFGDKGAGNYQLLSYLSGRFHYETCMIQKVEMEGEIISSTLIRELVSRGEMEKVTRCLGEPYTILGSVRHGNAIGRTVGIPTLNQLPEETKLLPPFGVYYSVTHVNGQDYYGMTNIGMKPTIQEQHKQVTVETHLYDFKGDLYGEKVAVSLETFRRPERRFSGIEELKSTMEADIAAGREYFGIGRG